MSVRYTEEKKTAIQKTLGITNGMAVPKIEKIVISMAVQGALVDKKNVEKVAQALMQIAGQKPKITKAKKSIASFKLREGDSIGVMVTLRGQRMYDFFEKLVGVVLARVRDFHGVPRSGFDAHGNYNLGFNEFIVFPEIDLGKVEKVQGLQVTIVTTASQDKDAMVLLEKLGMPFEKGGKE